MEAVQIKKVWSGFKFHATVMLRGFARAIYGALVAGLFLFAVYGFIATESEAGYVAVCDFIVSTATLVLALGNMYLMGSRKRGAKNG